MPLAEKALIARVRRLAGRDRRLVAGIGDDCAVLRQRPGHELLVTTDFSLEGVHFRRDWHPPESVGHRCLARGLSDIAAMGGEPVAAFLSLALPRDLPQTWIDRFLRGLIKLARKHNVTLAGGDTADSLHGILADIIVVGTVPKGKAILRSRARAGDLIYITGELGGSAAAIAQLTKKKRKLDPADYPRHFFPRPRIEVGRFLRRRGLATAMIDTSDGLSTDLAHICEESGVGAELQADQIRVARALLPATLTRSKSAATEVALQLALHGGEDYELLFTAPEKRRVPKQIAGVRITQIGQITRTRKMLLTGADGEKKELKPRGYQHLF